MRDEMYRRPTVTIAGAGDEIVLDGIGEGFTLKPGSTGLGTAPRELTMADLASGGAVLRHRRSQVREVFLPIDVHHGYGPEAYAMLEDSRRRLERLCDGEVEIRVETKDGARSAVGYLKEGLEGDFSTAVVNRFRMTLGLVFSCPDPWWYGLPREVSTRINALRKPLVTADGAEAVRRNLVLNPGIEYGRAGFGHFSGADAQALSTTNDAKSGDSALRVDAVEGSGTPHVLTPRFPAPVGSVVELAVEVKASPDVTHVVLSVYDSDGATGIMYPLGSSQPMPVSGVFSRVVFRPPVTRRPYLLFQVQMFRDDGSGRVDATAGSWIVLDEFIAEVGQVGEFFDGDTPDTATVTHEWEGAPGQSPSVRAYTGEAPPTPFFPVVLSDSTIQGAHVLEVHGDAEVWPTWTITGPGEDLLIQNDVTGERIFISGEFGEQVTVVTRPQEQDVFSLSSDRGGLWDRVSLDSVLFPLQPGENRIRMSMVNAKPSSAVTLSYRERYRAGH